jgi:hypothetical protein
MKLDMTAAENDQKLRTPDFWLFSNDQYSKPSTAVDGVSFPVLPTFKKFAIATTGIVASSTATAERIDVSRSRIEVNLTFYASANGDQTAAERYAQLRDDIVASGVRLLNDNELREEIRDRRGLKFSPDA